MNCYEPLVQSPDHAREHVTPVKLPGTKIRTEVMYFLGRCGRTLCTCINAICGAEVVWTLTLYDGHGYTD